MSDAITHGSMIAFALFFARCGNKRLREDLSKVTNVSQYLKSVPDQT
jgi:hypothetical protein